MEGKLEKYASFENGEDNGETGELRLGSEIGIANTQMELGLNNNPAGQLTIGFEFSTELMMQIHKERRIERISES